MENIKHDTWYYLDMDNNKPNPECGLFCARCKRKLKENLFQTYHSIVKHPIHPWFRLANGIERNAVLIGNDCLNKVITEYGIQE